MGRKQEKREPRGHVAQSVYFFPNFTHMIELGLVEDTTRPKTIKGVNYRKSLACKTLRTSCTSIGSLY
jgi:hypothetical protein